MYKSMKIMSSQRYNTHFTVNLVIAGNRVLLDEFYHKVKDYFLGDEIHRIDRVIIEGELYLQYCQWYTSWFEKLSECMQSVIQAIEDFNSKRDAELSYYFCRQLWWNECLVEVHTNAHETFFDTSVWPINDKAVEKALFNSMEFLEFTGMYLSDSDKRILETFGPDNWIDDVNMDEYCTIFIHYFEDIERLLLTQGKNHPIVKRFKRLLAEGETFEHVKTTEEQNFIASFVALAMLRVIKLPR